MTTDLTSTRDGFGLGLLQAAQLSHTVVGVCADLTESTRMQWFTELFPERFIQVGVAEQNLIGIAAGLALAGLHPFAATYACFSPANSWGVIRTSVCYNNLPVVIVGGHAGLTTGEDGATHQSLEDISLMRVLPNMSVLVPADGEEARQMTVFATTHHGPLYVRTSKHNTLACTTGHTFQFGKATELVSGSDGCILACGAVVSEALAAARELATQSIHVRVLNVSTIKPIDVTAILAAAQETKAILTVEDHQITGGLGSAVAEVLVEAGIAIPFRRLGTKDAFGESGKSTQLLEKYGLNASSISQAMTDLLSQPLRK